MRKAITSIEVNKAPKVAIDNFGTIPQSQFADVLFHAGKLTLKQRNEAKRIKFSSEYATTLLNDNLHLFPNQF